jgi:glycosyltransferase involved in cell wall biosynthesis
MTNRQDRIERELGRRRAVYETCKERALEHLEQARVDDALFWFSAAGVVGWNYHFGQWSDQEIDRALIAIAQALCEKLPPKTEDKKREDKGRGGPVAHLTSSVVDGGGHTEVVLAWCGLLKRYEHAEQLLVSSEWIDSREHGRNNLGALAELVDGYHLCPKSLSPAGKVLWLYERLREAGPETVIMHVNPNDVLALCAALMLRLSTGVQLVFFNHADHVFSLGIGLADRVIEHRREGARYSMGRRGIEPERIHMVPLGSRPRNSSKVSREALGVPEGCTVSMTVAAYYKLVPDEGWNFGRAIYDLLGAEPGHYHLIVGHGSQAVIRNIMGHFKTAPAEVRSRLVWLGRRTDIDALLGASDFLIESFPLAGGTLRTDAMRVGIPVVSIKNTRWPLITETGAFPEDYPLVAASNEEVVRFSRQLVSDAGLRALYARQLAQRYAEAFSEAVIVSALRNALWGRATGKAFPNLAGKPEYDLRYAVALGNRAVNIHEIEEIIEEHIGFDHRVRATPLSTRLTRATIRWTRAARAKFYPGILSQYRLR